MPLPLPLPLPLLPQQTNTSPEGAELDPLFAAVFPAPHPRRKQRNGVLLIASLVFLAVGIAALLAHGSVHPVSVTIDKGGLLGNHAKVRALFDQGTIETTQKSTCFDDQPSDARTMTRLICNETLPRDTYDLHLDTPSDDSNSSVAICVIGKTRSFSSFLAQESLRTNVAAAFGAKHTAFYFHLFPRDKRGDSRTGFNAEESSTVQESLASALRALRMKESDFELNNDKPWQGYHHLVSGSCGAEIVVDNRDDLDIFQSNMENYHQSKPIKDFNQMFQNQPDSFTHGFVNQWAGIKSCYDFVEREEGRMGYKFDYGTFIVWTSYTSHHWLCGSLTELTIYWSFLLVVIRTRPDMVYSRAVYPHCMFTQKKIWNQHDWIMVLPRKVMDFLNLVYNEGIMNDSNPEFLSSGSENPENYLFRMLNSQISRNSNDVDTCCTPEWKENHPRKDEMVGGAMLLRPRGPGFPRNVCGFNGNLDRHGQQLGFDPCMDLLQYNRYNLPFDDM